MQTTPNDEFLTLISRRQILSFSLQTSSNKEHKQTQTVEKFYMLHTATWERTHSKRTGDTVDQIPTYSKRREPKPGKGWWRNKLGRENSATWRRVNWKWSRTLKTKLKFCYHYRISHRIWEKEGGLYGWILELVQTSCSVYKVFITCP